MTQIGDNILLGIQRAEFAYPHIGASKEWRLVIEGIALTPNTIYSVIGSNMSGKSTLLRILAGLITVSPLDGNRKGPLLVFGRLASRNGAKGPKSLQKFKVRDAILLDHRDHMFPTLSIWDNVRVVGQLSLGQDGGARSVLDGFLVRSKISKLSSGRYLGDLSSGGQAYVRLARAYCCRSQLLLIDEVTAHLDDNNAQLFFDQLPEVIHKEAAVLIVSHLARDHLIAERIAVSNSISYGVIRLREEPASSGSTTCVEHSIC